MSGRPPRLAAALLRLLLPPQDRDELLGDLAELHARRARTAGRFRATLGYWRETVALVWKTTLSGGRGGRSRGAVVAGLLRDLQSAIRVHRRYGVQSAVALLTLAVGIGLGTAVLSAARALLFDRLPTSSPHEVVRIDETERGELLRALSEPDVQDWRRARDLFSHVSGFSTAARALTSLDTPERVSIAEVDGAFFPLFRVRPLIGRLITADDLAPGAERVAVLTERVWRSRFGASPAAVGRTIVLDHSNIRIVGIAPDAFVFPEDIRLWASLDIPAIFKDRRFHLLTTVARLSPDATLPAAQAAASSLATALARRDPTVHGERGVLLTQLQAYLSRDVRTPMHIVMSAAALVLFVACTNVAGLLLARASDRWREFGTRAALGASAWRLVRLAVADVYTLIGGATLGAVLIAYAAVRAARALAPTDLAVADRIVVDVPILAAGVIVALTAGAITSVIPAWRMVRLSISDALHSSGRTISSRRGIRHTLATVQLGAAVALTICAMLLSRSFGALIETDPGFRADRAVLAPVRLPLQKYPTQERYQPVLEDLLARVSAMDGVSSAALAFTVPLSPGRFETVVHAAGANQPEEKFALVNTVTPKYFETMRIPVMRGRVFTPEDRADPVVVVSERLAQTVWGRLDVVGQSLVGGPSDRWRVIGVIGDVKDRDLTTAPRPMLYRPFAQFPTNSVTLVVRSTDENVGLPTGIRAAITAVDRDIPVDGIAPLQSLVDRALSRSRFMAALVGVFSLVAVAVAMTGLYATLSYTVRLRRPEIGLRLALGATKTSIARTVAADVAAMLAAGLLLGLTGGMATAQFVRQLLFGVGVLDGMSMAVAAGVVVACACVASINAVRSAVAVDPTGMLRE